MNQLIPIIIVNWNGSLDTIECVESVFKSSHQNIFIYLVDNNSETKDKEALTKRYNDHPKLKLVLNKTNLGFAKAHNQIWNQEIVNLDFDYVCLINNDTNIDKDCLSNALKCGQEENADMVAFKMINYNDVNTLDSAGHMMLTNGEIIPVGHNQPIKNFNTKSLNFGPSGGACFYKKETLKRIGFFDSYFDTGYEDAELGFRNAMLGGKNIFCPEARIYHKGGQSIKKVFNKQYAIKTIKNILYTKVKLIPTPLLILYFPINTIRNILLILFSFVLFKWRYISIIVIAYFEFFTKDFGLALKARKVIKSQFVKGAFQLWKEQTSFVKFDIGRINSIFIKREPSAIDKYRE